MLGKIAVGVFLDLAKVFDTLDGEILLKKLEVYGVVGNALAWFRSYVGSRRQVVKFNGVMSSEKRTIYGTPQGSVLGPLIYIIYMNDFVNACEHLNVIMYADDTVVYYDHENLPQCIGEMNRGLFMIKKWLYDNKLALNVNKSHFVVFHRRKGKIPVAHVDVTIGGCSLDRKVETKFLGITIDCNLLWQPHITELAMKIFKYIPIFYNIRKNLTLPVLRIIYFSFVYPALTYGIIIWGSCGSTLLTSLYVIQKR